MLYRRQLVEEWERGKQGSPSRTCQHQHFCVDRHLPNVWAKRYHVPIDGCRKDYKRHSSDRAGISGDSANPAGDAVRPAMDGGDSKQTFRCSAVGKRRKRSVEPGDKVEHSAQEAVELSAVAVHCCAAGNCWKHPGHADVPGASCTHAECLGDKQKSQAVLTFI